MSYLSSLAAESGLRLGSGPQRMPPAVITEPAVASRFALDEEVTQVVRPTSSPPQRVERPGPDPVAPPPGNVTSNDPSQADDVSANHPVAPVEHVATFDTDAIERHPPTVPDQDRQVTVAQPPAMPSNPPEPHDRVSGPEPPVSAPTFATVSAWVAAGQAPDPAAGSPAEPASSLPTFSFAINQPADDPDAPPQQRESSPVFSLREDAELPTPLFTDPPPRRAEPPEQHVTLSIGTIDVTVEAPPAPEPLPFTPRVEPARPASRPMDDTARRLRRFQGHQIERF